MSVYWIIISLLILGNLGFIMFRLKHLYKDYLRVKLIESPEFYTRKYQSKNAETYYIKTTKLLKEEDDNPELITIKVKYNFWIKAFWYSMIASFLLLIIGYTLNFIVK